jgi:hypothetical protein
MWTEILLLVLKVVAWIIDLLNASEEAKKKFIEFVKQAAQDTNSAKLMKYHDRQLQWLKDNPWDEKKVHPIKKD